jgi:hypothetical protein
MLLLLHLYNTAPSISSQGFEKKIYQAEPQSISSLKKRTLLADLRPTVSDQCPTQEPSRLARRAFAQYRVLSLSGAFGRFPTADTGTLRAMEHPLVKKVERNLANLVDTASTETRIKSSTTQYTDRGPWSPRPLQLVPAVKCPLCLRETASR